MSSRILQNAEKGLEHGYKNFRKRAGSFPAIQKAGAGGSQRRYYLNSDGARTGGVRSDHAVFGLIRFLFQRVWFFNLYVCAAGEMAGAGNCGGICAFALRLS